MISIEKIEEDIREEALNDPPWFLYSSRGNFSIDFLREFKDQINWFYYCNGNAEYITKDIVLEFANYINWDLLSIWILDDIIYEKFYDKVDWTVFTSSHVNDLSEEFITKFALHINWIYVSMSNRNWSDEFLITNKKLMLWKYYFSCHKRKQRFIEKVADSFNDEEWEIVFKTQKVSEHFKKKWKKK